VKFQKNVNLAKYTSFHVGGSAQYFGMVRNREDLREAFKFARRKNLKVLVLGGGSNTLLPDKKLARLVLKIAIRGLKFYRTAGRTFVYAGSGKNWDLVVAEAVKKNLGGIENLSLIPGTVGGAIYQNIGAYGAEMKNVLESVEVFDLETGKIKILSNKACQFAYRNSIFQSKAGRNLVILGAVLRLNRYIEPNLKYPDLASYFDGKKNVAIEEIRRAVIEIRKSKLIYPTKNIGTAGSFFKNPIVIKPRYSELKNKFPDIKASAIGSGHLKLSAGQLIEKAGWKGSRLANVGVSDKHALVLVSYRNAKAKEIVSLAKKIQASVKNKFGIKLKPEVRIIT